MSRKFYALQARATRDGVQVELHYVRGQTVNVLNIAEGRDVQTGISELLEYSPHVPTHVNTSTGFVEIPAGKTAAEMLQAELDKWAAKREDDERMRHLLEITRNLTPERRQELLNWVEALPEVATTHVSCDLEIDHHRGVIYAHFSNEVDVERCGIQTVLRIQGLPRPIPPIARSAAMLDVTHMVGASWGSAREAQDAEQRRPTNAEKLDKIRGLVQTYRASQRDDVAMAKLTIALDDMFAEDAAP